MDKRALGILFDTFWSSRGWKPETERQLTAEDFAYAKSKRMMFDPVRMDHGQVLKQLSNSLKNLSKRTVADAFLASLSTRRLDWRSALGSFAVFQHLQPHSSDNAGHRCDICGFYLKADECDLNILNFERFKWGGVRHDCLEYAAMDLHLFLQSAVPEPTVEDVKILKNIFSAITAAHIDVTSAELHSHFAKMLKSNKSERDIIVAILGFCGILETPTHPGFNEYFVPIDQRTLPDRRFVDMAYPACWWCGEVGLNRTTLHEYFGHILA